jgi:phage terminase large subunit GpA-like protein
MLSPTQSEIDERHAEFFNTWNLAARLNSLFRPPPKITLSEWSDKYRRLSSESSAEPGHWMTDKAPYEREIMNAISDPFTPQVVIVKASQLGATDSAILNPIGYHVSEDPCPILVVQPTVEIAEAFSTDRLVPMFRDSPRLNGLITEARSRDSTNTLRRKSFKGGFLAIAGANSSATLSGRPVRIVLFDDVDRYPLSAGKEGDPILLGIARTKAFWNRKIVLVSSPSTKGISRIEKAFNNSTQEYWYLPCPKCEYLQILDWDRIDFDTVTHRCEACNKYFEKWQWLNGEGQWIAHRPVDEKGRKVTTRGFHLGGLINPWLEWELMIAEFVVASRAAAEGDIELLKVFRNTGLGLLWEDRSEKVDIDLYTYRREVYPPEIEIPDGVLVLTAGVDVGERQLNYEVVGWGRGKESWGIEYGWIEGDPTEEDVWTALDEAVYRRVFSFGDKAKIRIRRICVDSNYQGDYVHTYTRPRQPRCVSIRGEGGIGKPFIKAFGMSKFNRATVITLGVDAGKEEITHRLMVNAQGPGYCHFPKLDSGEPARGYDEEYFRGLTAEQRIIKHKHGFRTYIWIKRVSQRNEPFDVRNYALAALHLPHSGIKLDTMTRDILDPPSAPARSRYGAQPTSGIQTTTPEVTSTPAAAGPPRSRWGPQPSSFTSEEAAKHGKEL